jgi:hypothetical protein
MSDYVTTTDVLKHPCPRCHTTPGQPCVRSDGTPHRRRNGNAASHQDRVRAARDARANTATLVRSIPRRWDQL